MSYENIVNSIRLLTNNIQPELDITELLYRHNCTYLLTKIQAKNNDTDKLKTDIVLNQICIYERYYTCKDIFDLFENIKIPYAVIKGAVLSKTAYGNVSYRKSGDIDLLIKREDIDRVKQIMLDNGFIQGRIIDKEIKRFTRQELIFQTGMSHQTAPFLKKTNNPLCPYVNIDINTDILWGEIRIKTDMDFVLRNTEVASICHIQTLKLSSEMEFISLCLHHYKDMNSIYLLSQGSLKLSLFCDIYFYIKNTDLNLTQLQSICNHLCVSQYVYYCIFYTNLIFSDSVLNQYLSALKAEKAEGILNTFGLSDDEIREWEIGFFDRLFMDNINNYFNMHLSLKDLEKINTNKTFM